MPTALPKLNPKIEQMLQASGLPWRLEPRRRHVALIVDERLVQVVPRRYGERGGRQCANAEAAVRRALRAMAVQQSEQSAR